ncbi:MAG TPA: hypothetical protein VNV66_07165 [Pilimelia sp.]|nr:hypothetical protein [Pilimelia sp.]
MARAEFDAVIAALSAERFGPYLAAVHGDRQAAVRLYEWNSEVSATFLRPLQHLEVGLRNAMDRELAVIFGVREWWRVRSLPFTPSARDMVERAVAEAGRRSQNSSRARWSPHCRLASG